MRIQTIDTQVWWIAYADELRPTEGLDGAALLAAIGNAFGFPATPQTAASGGGYEFYNGFLRDGEKVVPVSKLAIYNDGINVNVQGSSASAEQAFQVVLQLAFDFGIQKPTTPPLHHYLSTIVADFEKSLDALFPASLLDKITEAGFRKPSHFLSLAFGPDQTETQGNFSGVNPNSFSIGRRVEVPFSLNRYFSQASAPTEKHLALLEQLEGLV